MRYILLALASGAATALYYYLRPPADPVGSYLPNFSSYDRRNRMIRVEAEQDYSLFNR